MFSNNDKISLRQFQILIIFDILNISIVTLPTTLSRIAGQDGYILYFIGMILSMIPLIMITNLSQKFPNLSFTFYTAELMGKPIASILTLIFAFKIIVTAGLQLSLFTEIINYSLLFNTPKWIIATMMLGVCAYCATKGYEVRGRLGEILIFFFLIPLAFVYILTIGDIDFTNLKPFFMISEKVAMSGSIYAIFAFSGIELILLAYPYVNNTHKIQRCAIKAVIFAGITGILIIILTMARFGIHNIIRQDLSVIEIMDTIELKRVFLERQNALFTAVWIISAFMIINGGIFFSALLIKDFVCIFSPYKDFNSLEMPKCPYVLLVFILILLTSFVPKNVDEITEYFKKINYTLSLFFLFIVPIILLLMAKIKNIGGEKN